MQYSLLQKLPEGGKTFLAQLAASRMAATVPQLLLKALKLILHAGTKQEYQCILKIILGSRCRKRRPEKKGGTHTKKCVWGTDRAVQEINRNFPGQGRLSLLSSALLPLWIRLLNSQEFAKERTNLLCSGEKKVSLLLFISFSFFKHNCQPRKSLIFFIPTGLVSQARVTVHKVSECSTWSYS